MLLFSWLVKLFLIISFKSESLKKVAKMLKGEIIQKSQETLLVGQKSTGVKFCKVMVGIVKMTMETSAEVLLKGA